MNVKALTLITGALWLLLASTTVQAGVGQWLRDPLRANPEQLRHGVALPGDSVPPSCQAMPDLTQPLSLEDAADLALCRNPKVNITWAEIRAEAAGLGQARAAFLPTATASISIQHDATTYPGAPLYNSNVNGYGYYGNLGWRVFDFGTRAGNRRNANHLLSAALAAHNATLQSVLDGLITAWFDAVAGQAALAARLDADALAKRAVAAAQRRESGGAGTHSDVLLAEVASAKATLALAQAQGASDKAEAALIYAMGLPAATSVRIPDLVSEKAVPLGDLEAWLDLAKREHPEIISAHEQWLAAKEKIRATRASGRPTVDFGVNVYDNGYPNQGLQPQRNRQFTVGLTASIPLFDGFSNHYQIEQAKAEADVKQAQFEDDEHNVLMTLIKAYADARASAGDLDASQNYVTASDEAVRSAQRRYDGGATSLLELLTAQSNLADARQQRVRSLADWNAGRLRLMTSAGEMGLTRLNQPPDMVENVPK